MLRFVEFVFASFYEMYLLLFVLGQLCLVAVGFGFVRLVVVMCVFVGCVSISLCVGC